MQQFDLDHDTLSTLILEGDWKNNPAVWDKERQIDKLAELVLAEKMIITQRRAPEPPKAESAVTTTANDIGNRSVGLGPQSSSPPKHETTPLEKDYIGESDGNNPGRWNEPFECEYLNEDERKKYEIGVKNGKLIHLDGSNAGELFDTSDAASHWGGGGSAIFVMSENGKIYASKKHEPMFFHHSSFLAGEPVASAGELVVEDGKLIEVSNKSGHYKPDQKKNDQLLSELRNKGMSQKDLNNVIRTGV